MPNILYIVQSRYTRFFTHFGVLRVVSGTHLRLLAPWAMRLISQ